MEKRITLFKFGVPTNRGNIYLVRDNLMYFSSYIDLGRTASLMYKDYTDDGVLSGDLIDVCGIIKDIEYVNNSIVGTVTILDTPKGLMIQKMLNSNEDLYISPVSQISNNGVESIYIDDTKYNLIMADNIQFTISHNEVWGDCTKL